MSDPIPPAARTPPVPESGPGPVPGPNRRSNLLLGVAGVLAAALMIGIAAILWLTRGPDGLMAIGGPFSLVDQEGRAVTERSYAGKHMLVFFGFTFCPDICPTTLARVADAMDHLGPQAGRVVPVFITVDAKRDTPAAMKQYVAAFSPAMVGLTGSPEQVAAAARAYRVYFKENRTGPGPDDYTMDHSSILYLMGPDGRFIAPLRAEASGEQIATDIARHLR